MSGIEKIIRDKWEKTTIKDLSTELNLSPYHIVRIAQRLSLKRKHKVNNYFEYLKPQDLHYIKRRWFKDDLIEIGRHLKIPPMAIGNIGKKMGLLSKSKICIQRREKIYKYLIEEYGNTVSFGDYPKKTILNIVKKFKVDRRTVEIDLTKLGLYAPPNKREEYKKVDRYIIDNWEKINIQTIAKNLGKSRRTIWQHIKSLPLPPKNRKGTNSGKWKGGCSHTNKRKMNAIRKSIRGYRWENDVKLRDAMTCQKCNGTGHRNKYYQIVGVTAHHIKNFYDYPSLRFDVNNGITLCIKCHDKFHHKYGYRHTNQNQLTRFIKHG